jgi:epoxyqueuosine reductase
MSLDNRIKELADSLGADYCGVADLGAAREFIEEQGGQRVAGYPRAVVMGMRLLDTYVDLLREHDDPVVAGLYRHHTYDVVNAALDQMALRVANEIQGAGYKAFPVAASKRASDEKIAAVFSQKLAARMAGFGWIGKSCLLVTPDHGPRVRWIAVLTNAPLAPTGTPMESRCGKCTACVDACPVQAFTGRPFDPSEPREARFDAAACDRYYKEMEQAGTPGVCGMCLYICPYGQRSAKKQS